MAQSIYQFINPVPIPSAAKSRISNIFIKVSNAVDNSKIQKQNSKIQKQNKTSITKITTNAASRSTICAPAGVHITTTRCTVGQHVGGTTTRTVGITNHNQDPEPRFGSGLSPTSPLQFCNSSQNCISFVAQRQIFQQRPGARHHLQRHRFPSTRPTSSTTTSLAST